MISGVHLLATLCLFLFTLIIFVYQVDPKYPNLVAYDRIRMHTIDRVQQSIPDAVKAVSTSWPLPACAQLTNISQDNTCVTARTALQTSITSAMGCVLHRGQLCSVLAQVLTGVIQLNKTALGTIWAGKVLDANYQNSLTGFLQTAPNFFRPPYMATQDNNMMISRFSLYIYINCAIFFNTAIHCIDKWFLSGGGELFLHMSYGFWRRATKTVALASLFIVPFSLYMRDTPGANLAVSFLLIFPGLWSFMWYEFFLPNVPRPW